MAPRAHKHQALTVAPKTLIIDNGAYNIKAGFSYTDHVPNPDIDCHVIPNCIAKGAHNRIYAGAQLDACTDFAEMMFRRPVQKGLLVNWEAEREIWDQSFFRDCGAPLHCDPSDTNLILTEAPNGFSSLQANCDQMVFEEFEFAAYRRLPSPALNAWNETRVVFGDPLPSQLDPPSPAEAVFVIDVGYSHTTCTPLYKGLPIQQAVRRLDIAGKFMTNYLKDVLSVRQLDVRQETYIVNHLKESTCFVSGDFKADIERSRRQSDNRGLAGDDEDIICDYIMPDFTNRFVGAVKAHDAKDKKSMAAFGHVRREDGTTEAVLTVGNERFTAPELLFQPGIVGMQQAGVAEMVMQCMRKVPTGLWGVFLSNIWVTGGCAKLPGLQQRLFDEIREVAPVECTVRVRIAPDPVKSTWLGGARLASNPEALRGILVTRQEYQEMGTASMLRRL